MNEKIKQYQLRLFNKLFSTLPAVKRMNEDKSILNLNEPITHLYFFHNKKFWFAKGETDEKYYYLFGKNPLEPDIGESDATLIIDFDKNNQINDDNLGLFRLKDSEIHILINNNILNQRFPYFNTGNFKISQFESDECKLNFNVIDLGGLNRDFIENIEKFIELSPKINKQTQAPEKDQKQITAIKDNSYENDDLCEICSKDKKNIKIHPKLKKLSNLKPNFCGTCIEKIVVSEFYQKITPFINSSDIKSLDFAKEKFSNDELFDLGIELLEKYDIIRYFGMKKQLFTIDSNQYILKKFIKYSNNNYLLIDNIFQVKKTKSQDKKIDISQTDLTRETKAKMNLFINSLESGKTPEKAYEIAKTDAQKVENWYTYGKKGDKNYIPFYEKYKLFRPENKEKQRKMEIFLDTLKKDADIDNALKKSDLEIGKVRAWYSLGEKDNDEYKDFYLACKILLPNGIPKKETKKIVNNDELINEFITLIEDGKTNDEAINQLKIPKFKVKNWVNQGKLGNKKYIDFYNAYMIEINNKKRLNIAKKQKKHLKKQIKEKENKKAKKEDTKITTRIDERICKICGRKLNKKTKKDICKRCSRKQYASKILLKLLKSIEPEKPFKKEDLKVLDLQNIQITDYVWTLQEFNLIEEKNNKLQLKNKNILETFIKESGLKIDEIPQEETTVKLNKTCKTCGETLEISKFFTSETTEDGFEDNCKDCKRLITAADYLKEIHEIVEYGSEFSEDELKPHFKSPFQLQAKIWALLDNDLVKKNFESNNYTLTDEKTAEKFLDKYYMDKEDKKSENTQYSPNEKNSQDYTKKEQQSIIIKAISEGKSRKEAAEIANIPLYKITHWYNEGKQGYGSENANFYKQLRGLEKINSSKNKTLKNKMNEVLDELKIENDISKVTKSNANEIKEWIEKGKHDEEPYDYFYDSYKNIIYNDHINEEKIYEKKAINRKIFLENFKNGKSKEKSAEYGNIDLSLIHDWYLKGREGKEPYTEFYEKYIEIKNNDIANEIPQIKKTDKFGSELSVTQMNLILESLAKGMSEKEAVDNANISENTYKYWLNRGKQKFGDVYIQFYQYVNKLKDDNTLTPYPSNKKQSQLNEILIPLDEKYELLFKSSKMNRTGIAWVNIIGKQWIYQKSHNNQVIKLSNSNIYKLYQEVMHNNLPWGIRDLNLAKPLILKYYEINEEEYSPKLSKSQNISQKIDDPGIYAPLPEKYEQSFKSSPMNKSGIAWVNNPGAGTRWIYEKRIDGTLIRFIDEDIYNLYKKVKSENHVWGIRDYNRAKKFIDIPDDFKIHQKQKTVDKSQIIPEIIDPDIYAPLPSELSITFNPTQANKTGIAWVNKSGSNWRYSRQINGESVEVIDENIYELHKKVKNLNYDWGIRDYEKARDIIKIPNDYQPHSEEFEQNIINTDIFAPLPNKYKNTFNPNHPNKTGIAWVNPVGNKWVYQRKMNGIPIKFSDSDIRKLHEVVIKNNHIWGIIDYDKAEKIIETNIIPSSNEEKIEKMKPAISSNNVTVTCMQKSVNDFDIIIKGIIKNKELIKVLNRLELFEEDIKRIITTSINNQVDMLIELELSRYSLKSFEEEIDDLNWKINK